MTAKICFSSDFHGNEHHYEQIVEIAGSNGCSHLFIGGDLFQYRTLPKDQISYFKSKIIPVLSTFRGTIVLIFGNCDFKGLIPKLTDLCPKNVHLVVNDVFTLNENIDVLCLSDVPFTPFSNRDFERYDGDDRKTYKGLLSYEPKTPNVKITGKDVGNMLRVQIHYDDEYTMKFALEELEKKMVEGKKYLLLSHSPPYNTENDRNTPTTNDHYGSRTLREYIKKWGEDEEKEIVLGMFGHIHGCGTVTDKLGGVCLISSGNQPKFSRVAGWIIETDGETVKFKKI